MSKKTTARAKMIQDARAAADRLRDFPDLAATVRTFRMIVEDSTAYEDDSALACTRELRRLAQTHNPCHSGTQTYADYIEGFCSQEGRGCPACPSAITGFCQECHAKPGEEECRIDCTARP